MTCNGSIFNFNDLDGVSVENEAWISTHCVSNRLKFGVFVFYIAAYSLFVLTFAALAVVDLLKGKERTLPLMKQIIFLCFVASLVNLIRIVLYFIGVVNRWKFIVYPISLIIVFYMTGTVLKAWVRTLTGLANFGKIDNKADAQEDRIFRNFMIYVVISFSILEGIGPIASFSDPWVLNWIFSFGFCNQVLAGEILLLFLYSYGKKLLKRLEKTQENLDMVKAQEEIKAAIIRIKRTLFVIKAYIPSMILPIFMGPIWMGVTSTATNPVMEYSFYMLAFVDELIQFFAFPSFIYGVLYASFKLAPKKDGVHLEEKAETANSSFSYKVEDLNPSSEPPYPTTLPHNNPPRLLHHALRVQQQRGLSEPTRCHLPRCQGGWRGGRPGAVAARGQARRD